MARGCALWLGYSPTNRPGCLVRRRDRDAANHKALIFWRFTYSQPICVYENPFDLRLAEPINSTRMSTFKIDPTLYVGKRKKDFTITLQKPAFELFNPAVLGLGDITQESRTVAAIAAFFDLQGFTNFSKQIDSHLSIPLFLNEFLEWIFSAIRSESQRQIEEDVVRLWHDLPFLAKFMGDGVLFLWNTEFMGSIAQHNLIRSLYNICTQYETAFYPSMRRKVVDPPLRLRCGVAKGSVFSVGNGEDYVGPCINMAARLQKLFGLSFAFARRGFDPESGWKPEQLKKWVLKVASIRGIGEAELIYTPAEVFEALEAAERENFRDP